MLYTDLDLILTSPSSLMWQGREYPCLIGKGGISASKQEGDGATPIGRFPLRYFYWRPDRLSHFPNSEVKAHPLTHSMGWCDAPLHPQYNQLVTLPFEASHEQLWREDSAYDIIGVMGYNDDPVTPHKGSAIFLHVWRDGATHTEGCIALKWHHLLEIIPGLTVESHITIPPL